MRVVLDTNVLLAGVMVEGLCKRLLDRCLVDGACEVVVSSHILDELRRVAADKLRLPPQELAAVIAAIASKVAVVAPASVPTDACRDTEDLPVLGTLVAAQADWLVTGDKDLLAIRSYEGRPIVSPREFWHVLSP